MNETTLRQLLHGVAAETPRGTEVDSYTAAETARQQQRRRRQLVLAGAAALVLLVTTASVVLALVTDRRAAPVTTPPPSAPTSVAPTAFDPARSWVRPGWLPAGLDQWELEQEAQGARYTATAEPGSGPKVAVYVAARGGRIPDQPSDPAVRGTDTEVAGPLINGAESTFRVRSTDSVELLFGWAPGAPGSVDVEGVANAKDVAVRVAREFRVLVGTPTPLPFASIRPKVPLTRLDITHNEATSTMRVMYLGKNGVGPGVEIDLNRNGVPPTTDRIGPYAVAEQHVSGGEYHYMFQADPDTTVQVVTRPESTGPEAVAPAIELAERAIAEFRMVGDVRDPSSWK